MRRFEMTIVRPAPLPARRPRHRQQHLDQPLLVVDRARQLAAARDRDRTGLLGNHHARPHRSARSGPAPRGGECRCDGLVRGCSASGKKHPAASIRPSRTTTAPSCSGDAGAKIESNSSSEISACSIVPLSQYSLSPLCCSITISAPRLLRQAGTRCARAQRSLGPPGAPTRLAVARSMRKRPPRPICSSARRNSG